MEDKTFGLACGLTLGLIFGMLIGTGFTEFYKNKEVKELGKSICEEEYRMDFESYYKGTLKCKPFTESYDGIKVEMPKAQTTDLKKSCS